MGGAGHFDDVVDTRRVVPAAGEDDHGGVEELAHGLAALGAQGALAGGLPGHDGHLGAAGRSPFPVRAALRASGAHRVWARMGRSAWSPVPFPGHRSHRPAQDASKATLMAPLSSWRAMARKASHHRSSGNRCVEHAR